MCIGARLSAVRFGQFFFQNLDRAADSQDNGAQIVGLAFNLGQLRLPGLEFRFQLPQSVRQLFLHIIPQHWYGKRRLLSTKGKYYNGHISHSISDGYGYPSLSGCVVFFH